MLLGTRKQYQNFRFFYRCVSFFVLQEEEEQMKRSLSVPLENYNNFHIFVETAEKLY